MQEPVSEHYEPMLGWRETEEQFHIRMARNARQTANFWVRQRKAWDEPALKEFTTKAHVRLNASRRIDNLFEARDHDRKARAARIRRLERETPMDTPTDELTPLRDWCHRERIRLADLSAMTVHWRTLYTALEAGEAADHPSSPKLLLVAGPICEGLFDLAYVLYKGLSAHERELLAFASALLQATDLPPFGIMVGKRRHARASELATALLKGAREAMGSCVVAFEAMEQPSPAVGVA